MTTLRRYDLFLAGQTARFRRLIPDSIDRSIDRSRSPLTEESSTASTAGSLELVPGSLRRSESNARSSPAGRAGRGGGEKVVLFNEFRMRLESLSGLSLFALLLFPEKAYESSSSDGRGSPSVGHFRAYVPGIRNAGFRRRVLSRPRLSLPPSVPPYVARSTLAGVCRLLFLRDPRNQASAGFSRRVLDDSCVSHENRAESSDRCKGTRSDDRVPCK